MATIESVIRRVDDIKPNAFSYGTKVAWLSEVEGLVQTEVMLLAIEEVTVYGAETDGGTELLARAPHDKIYWSYLSAMIDFANGEYNRYENTMQLFNSFFGEYMRWFATRYRPADVPGTAEEENLFRGYYISAYGIAVKHGYEGTEEEWLSSLQGASGEKGDKGDKGDGLMILGAYESEADLRAEHPSGETGDCYKVGDTENYLIYYWDAEASAWDTVSLRGEKGERGATGEKGDKGDTGEQGPKGDKGDTGQQGPKGDKGDTGEQGPRGDKGETGSGFTVYGYYETLSALAAAHPVAEAGVAYGVGAAEPYDIYIWDGVGGRWVNNGPLQGARGEKGDPGEKGPRGEAGAPGAKAVGFSAVLTAAGWTGGVQTVTDARFLAVGYLYIVSPSPSDYLSYAEAKVYAEAVTEDGNMTFHVGEVPAADITVNICRLEATENGGSI